MNKIWGLIFLWFVALLAVMWAPPGNNAVKHNSPSSIAGVRAPDQAALALSDRANPSHPQMVARSTNAVPAWNSDELIPILDD